MNFVLRQGDVMVTHLVLPYMSIANATYGYQPAVNPKGPLGQDWVKDAFNCFMFKMLDLA